MRKMMKKSIQSVCLLTSLFLLFALVSCSAVRKSDLVGTYDLVSITGGGMNLTEEQVDAMEAIGMTSTLEIREDDTAIMDIYGTQTRYGYQISKMIFTADGKNTKFRFDGSRITIEAGSATIVFEKRG